MMRTILLLSAVLTAVVTADDTVVAQITNNKTGMKIASDYASFSYEVPCAIGMFSFNNNSRTSFVNLMNNLKDSSGGNVGPNMRIGGNSADESVYIPNPNTPLPTNDTYRITDADIESYLYVNLWNGTITPGLNYRDATSADLAVAHVNALSKIIGYESGLIRNVEIGNECDIFYENGIRPSNYAMKDYLNDFSLYEIALSTSTSIPYPLIQGATFCCHRGDFDAGLPGYMNTYTKAGGGKDVLNSLSYHEYPLNVCNGNKHANTIYQLLAESSVHNNIVKLQPYVDAANALGLRFIIGEGNSVACGGQEGVSDVFATTLWSVDTLFAHAAAGIQSYNAHGCESGAYTAIGYPDKTQDIPSVNALYYGMWAFTSATARSSQIYNTTIVKSTNDLIKVWSVLDTSGAWRITTIHKDPNATVSATVTVSLPAAAAAASGGGAPSGKLTRVLSQNGVFAKTGFSFGGLTFDGSTDGKPSGTPTNENVPANADGSYTFSVSPASIAILSIVAA